MIIWPLFLDQSLNVGLENEKISNEVSWKLWNFMTFNPLTPEIWSLILLSSFYIFPCKLVMRIWC